MVGQSQSSQPPHRTGLPTRLPCGATYQHRAYWLLGSAPVPMRCSEGRGFPGCGRGHASLVTTACVARVAVSPRTRYAPRHAHPQTHGGPMQHPHEVDMVLAILDTQEIMVYGRDLRRPLVA